MIFKQNDKTFDARRILCRHWFFCLDNLLKSLCCQLVKMTNSKFLKNFFINSLDVRTKIRYNNYSVKYSLRIIYHSFCCLLSFVLHIFLILFVLDPAFAGFFFDTAHHPERFSGRKRRKRLFVFIFRQLTQSFFSDIIMYKEKRGKAILRR